MNVAQAAARGAGLGAFGAGAVKGAERAAEAGVEQPLDSGVKLGVERLPHLGPGQEGGVAGIAGGQHGLGETALPIGIDRGGHLGEVTRGGADQWAGIGGEGVGGIKQTFQPGQTAGGDGLLGKAFRL